VTGRETTIATSAEITLGPYELRAFTSPPEGRVEVARVSIPPDLERDLLGRARDFLEKQEVLRKKSAAPAGSDEMARSVRESLEGKRYARLRRELASYAVQKTIQVAGAD
jgi:hypothetical protein